MPIALYEPPLTRRVGVRGLSGDAMRFFCFHLMHGVVSPAHAQAYLRGIAGAELVVLPRCGHLPQAEQPEALAHAVLSYLARLGA